VPPFVARLPVRFSDVDHAGIVYYPRFFHYFHVAFEELWRARVGARAYSDLIDGTAPPFGGAAGRAQVPAGERERIGFPAVRAECDFKAPLRFGDTAEIALSITRLGGKSITFRYRVFRAEPRQLAAEGAVVCAVVDLARFVAVAIPEHVTAVLQDLVEP